VIAAIQGVGVGLALANLFFLPSTWLELPAYAVAAAESFYVTAAIGVDIRSGLWRRIPREVPYILANLALIVGMLVVAAVFEVTEIQLEQVGASASPTSPSQALPLLTWLPFFVVLAVGIVYWRRARREAPALYEREREEATARAPQEDLASSGDEGGGGPPSPA
jgi:hypothetical protein